jgi:hypothetical protein
MANENLGAAKKAKNDEFYTQYEDIEKEMNAYLDYDKNVFKNKTILLPCDDPEWSNFTKYFAQNFEKLGLKKLISTSYAPNSKNLDDLFAPTEYEIGSEKYDKSKSESNGRIFTLSRDTNRDRRIDFQDIEWDYLEGDGDFRSEELRALRDQSDMIITNPPFSLFRPFLAWIVEASKQFVIIGNMNAITYKEVFPLIQNDAMWLGQSISSGDREFRVPESYPLEAAGWRVDEDGNKFIRVKGVRWFTNLEHGRRHQPLPLMTMEDNLKFSKHKEVKDVGYQTYDNYDAIEIPFTDAIPSNQKGVMGVPISFLDKYNPEQFEIIALSRYQGTGMKKEFVDAYFASGQTGQISEGHPDLCYYDRDGKPVVPYRRILIRHRKPAK